MAMQAVTHIDLPLRRVASGKVREIFDLGQYFLFVATDRISAYDVIMPNGIPFKGRVLTQLSLFWFEFLGVDHHVVSTRLDDLPAELGPFHQLLEGRFIIVKKLNMIPVECVARGYLAGSGYKDYTRSGKVCGIDLPPGLQNAQKLPQSIFTPASKAESGHDENISFTDMTGRIGRRLAENLRRQTLDIYTKAADYARKKGIIIADTKFEFGLEGDRIVLADEVLTPDSSRYWPLETYQQGKNPPSFDKQFVRDYLSSVPWNKEPPGPRLPNDIIAGTTDRYLVCYQRLTGNTLG